MYETNLVCSCHLPRLLCSVRWSTVGLHQQVLRTALILWFVYRCEFECVDITRSRDGVRKRSGWENEGKEEPARNEIYYCLQKQRGLGQLAFLLSSAIGSPFLCVMQVRNLRHLMQCGWLAARCLADALPSVVFSSTGREFLV
jgi:hypothetical protein